MSSSILLNLHFLRTSLKSIPYGTGIPKKKLKKKPVFPLKHTLLYNEPNNAFPGSKKKL